MKIILVSIFLFVENFSKKEYNPLINQIVKLFNKDVSIRRYTYGFQSTQIYTWGEEIDVTIGRFCSNGAELRLFCGGNSAKFITYSFSSEIIEILLELKCWNFDGSIIEKKSLKRWLY